MSRRKGPVGPGYLPKGGAAAGTAHNRARQVERDQLQADADRRRMATAGVEPAAEIERLPVPWWVFTLAPLGVVAGAVGVILSGAR